MKKSQTEHLTRRAGVKTHQITLHLTAKTHKAIQETAAAAGESMSLWAEKVFLEALEGREKK